MTFLAQSKKLGILELIEVYIFYDKPVLFSCKNRSGLIYIVLSIDETDVSEIWLYAPISKSRFQSLVRGEIELRSVFTDAEDAFVYRVEIPYENESNTIVNLIECHEIPEDDLPEAGETIQCETIYTDISIKTVSVQKRREIVDFILQFPAKETTEAPIGEVASILSSLQGTIDAIGQIKSGKSESHIIPQEVKEKTQMVMSGTFEGSFGMRLEGTKYEEDKLALGESFLGQCLNEFLELINIGANEYALQAKLNFLKRKTALKYTEFLNAITRIEVNNIHIDWASPDNNFVTGEIERETVFKALDVIKHTKIKEDKEICVNVILTKIDFANNKVTLQEEGLRKKKKKYDCTIANSAMPDIETISKGQVYFATIQDYITLYPVHDKEQHEYELLSLKKQTEH